jgi:hypothetical protein
MKAIYVFLLLILISGCKNQLKNQSGSELTIHSIQLIKKGQFNDDLIACCFTAAYPSSFSQKITSYGIKEVTFPLAKDLGIDFYRWKIKRYSLDSTAFVLGLFVPHLKITKMDEDSIDIITAKLKTAPQIVIILENDDTLRLKKSNYKKLNEMKAVFSVNDTNWVGISK